MDKVKFERKGVQIIVKSGLRKRDWEKWSGSIGQIEITVRADQHRGDDSSRNTGQFKFNRQSV